MIKQTLIPIISFLCFYQSTNAQAFEYVGDSPFGIEIANFETQSRLALKYVFEDEDGDGDLDLFLFGLDETDSTSYNPSFVARLRYFMEFQENIGDKYNPQFAPRQDKFSSFEFPTGKSFVIPDVGDLNGDKKQDFFISSEVDEYSVQFPLIYLREDDESFDKTRCTNWDLDPINNYSFFIPDLVDLDMDGDLDILMSGYTTYDVKGEEQVPTFLYAKNIGSLSDPEFLGWFENPYGLTPSDYNQMLNAGDIDLDGDVDILSISQKSEMTEIEYFENIPDANGKPAFQNAIIAPFGLPQPKNENDAYLFPSLVDIDGDGDVDVFFFRQEEIDDETTNVTLDFYENKICNANLNTMVEENGFFLTAIQDANYTYQWFDCDTGEELLNATSHQFEAGYTGSFAVSITDSRGCKDESDCYYVIVSGTGDKEPNASIEVFPNPSRGQINLVNRSGVDIVEIMIYDIQGRIVARIKRDFDKIDLSGNKQGLYLLKVVLDEGELVKEVILTR